MSYLAQAIVRDNLPDTIRYGYARSDAEIGSDRDSALAAKGRELDRSRPKVSDSDRTTALDVERRRFDTAAYGPYGQRLLGGAAQSLGGP